MPGRWPARKDCQPWGGGGGDGAAAAPGSGRGKEGGAATPGLVRATPRYESNPAPLYPHLAKRKNWQGTVRLRTTVTAGGQVAGVLVERSSGHEVLDLAALAAVQRWRFLPATRGGVPVACEVIVPVAFRLTQ